MRHLHRRAGYSVRRSRTAARFILAKQQVEIIGITGSVGKTTAKEAIAAVLGAIAPDSAVFKNRANYNGLFGLPIALGELRPEQRIAVLEMAADHLGEIAAWPGSHRPTSRW